MNSLNFIDQAITQMKLLLEHTKTMLKLPKYEISEDLKKHYEQDKKNIEEQILHLQQIKSELEAWEVVKPSIHHIKEQRCFVIHNLYQNEQYDFIMKGLKKH